VGRGGTFKGTNLAAETPAQRLEQLAGRPGVSADLLTLETTLLAWRHSLEDDIRARHPRTQPDRATLRTALAGEAYLAALIDPLPQPGLLDAAATTLADALRERIAAGAALHGWLAELRGSDPGSGHLREEALSAWFTAAWRRDPRGLAGVTAMVRAAGPAGPGDLDSEVLEWAGRQLGRPFFHRLGELLAAEAGASVGARPTCPSCGGPPRYSRLERDEGRRFLWCDLCNVQWPFRRLTCPFCGNTEQQKLGYLSIEQEAHHRIDVCEVCRCYLRAVDERGLSEGQRVDFLVEDLGTVHLCMVTEGQGYRPGGTGPAVQE
jgi:hypothetical protein